MESKWIGPVGVILLVLVGFGVLIFRSPAPLSLEQAVAAAKASPSCTQMGTVGTSGFYNENSKTWWIDFTPSAEYVRPGCNPACVVSASSTVEINWRCTGLIEPATSSASATP